jgi:GT2 family glycosyltransferase
MNEAQKVSVNFVTWNAAAYLPGCFASLDEQDMGEFTVTVVDNASNDGTVKWLQDNRPDVTVLRNFRNQGAARARNQAIALALSRWADGSLEHRYLLFASPEIEFAPSCLRLLIETMDRDPSLAACGPKILRVQFRAGMEDDHRESERSTTIESTGLCVTKSRAVFERGAGEDDKGQYDSFVDVFGFSGACVLVRASALEQLKLAGEWFDEDFFEDWDDIDLAWRLRRVGMRSQLVPEAIVWRHVSLAGAKRVGRRAVIVRDPARASRNRLWTMWKNDEFGNQCAHSPWILAGWVGRTIASLIRPQMLTAGLSAYGGWGKMAKKRTELQARAKLSGPEMRKWFV